jgi:hypothetical protein
LKSFLYLVSQAVLRYGYKICEIVISSGALHVLIRLLFHFDIRLYSIFFCKFHTFITYFTTHASSFILMTVSVDRAIKIKNLKEVSKKKINSLPQLQTENRITIDLNKLENTDGQILDVRFNGIESSKNVSIKVKFRKTKTDSIRTIRHSEKNIISSIHIKQKPGKKRTRYNFLSLFTVNSIVFLIFLVLAISNFHFILFLKLFLQKVEIGKIFNTMDENTVSGAFKFLNPIQKDVVEYFRCAAHPGSNYEFFMKTVWYWTDLMSFSLVPFFVMCICSLIIAVEFKNLNDNYLKLIAQELQFLNKNNYLRKIRKNRQICLMLFNSNFLFFFVNSQYWICFFMFRFINGNHELFDQLQSFSNILLYTNNVFNFLIFGFTSSKYRHELISLFILQKK